MRRIAAVFASKRSDRSDATSSSAASSAASATTDQSQQTTKPPSAPKRFFRSISRKSKPVDPVLNRLSSSDLHPPSSSSSSSGAPTTPDDDRGSLLKLPSSKLLLPLPYPVDSRLGSFHHLDTAPHDRSPFSATSSRLAPSPSTLDLEDDSSEESLLVPDISKPTERSTPLSAPAYLLALTTANLRPPYAPPPLLHVSAGPLHPRSCNLTRNIPYSDSLESTMHRTSLQRRLQRGDLSPTEARSIASFAGRRSVIKDRPSLHLDDCAVRGGRITLYSAGLKRWAGRPCFEDRALVLLAENVPAMSDPSSNRQPLWTRVESATGLGVADIEYSLALELLAGLYEDVLPFERERTGPSQGPDSVSSASHHLHLDTQLSLDLGPSLIQSPTNVSPSSSNPPSPAATMSAPATLPTTSSSRPVSASALSPQQSRGQVYKTTPSPLRVEAVSASPPTPITPAIGSAATIATSTPANVLSPATPSPRSAASVPAPLRPALKQGVRFAEEEKEDQIPLGYVMRIKQKREEKARFLQQERERRRHEEERRKHEEEKRKWEQERAAWEREKRLMEEERKKKLYAEEVANARSRRESQRFPMSATPSDGLATGQWDRGERGRPEREASGSTVSRPAYDLGGYFHMPPRQNSDSSLAVPQPVHRGSTSGSGSGSPGDSRPSSLHGSGSGGSRPPSMHSGVPTPSSSQQDVRSRERRMSNTGSRRGSMVSESGSSWRRSSSAQIPPLPTNPSMWTMGMNTPMTMPMNMPMNIPPMQMGMPMMQMPMMYGMDMSTPLLPPSPPFMMQQHGYRPPSQSSNHPPAPQRSHSSSPTLGRHNLPASGSSEHVNRASHPQPRPRESSASTRAPSVPRSESSQQRRPTHSRSSSGETPKRLSAAPRSRTESDRRSSRLSQPLQTPSQPRPNAHPSAQQQQQQRPRPSHSSSLPPNPPVAFSQPRSSWALPQTGFENVSRPAAGRRQTIIS